MPVDRATARDDLRVLELAAGPIEVRDSGGDGPTVVLLHGLLMDHALWDAVVADLAADHRCVVPTLPLGAHRRAMGPDADLSLPGVAQLVTQVLEGLDLRDVVLVGNDTGGAVAQLVVVDGAARVGALVLVSCEAFDNMPPGLTGRAIAMAGRLPPWLFGLSMQPTRLKAVRRAPIAFGWLTKRGDATTAGWLRPLLKDAALRRDAVSVLRQLPHARAALQEATQRLVAFDRPALVVWATEDRVMPLEHGHRLAALLRTGGLVELGDCLTLIPLDQPHELSAAIRRFTRATSATIDAR